VGQIITLLAKIRRWPIQLHLAYTSDNKLIIYRFKRGFFVGYVYKKGLDLLWAKTLKKLDGTVISVAMVQSRQNRSKDQSSSIWMEL